MAVVLLASPLLLPQDRALSHDEPVELSAMADGPTGTNALAGRIVVAVSRPLPIVPIDGGSDIWTFAPDGSDGVNLTGWFTNDRGEGTFEYQPVWSRDGTKIAFAASCCRSGTWEKLWVMDADGSNARRVTTDSDDIHWSTPELAATWSPGGDRLAFVRGGKGGQAYIVHLDGTEEGPIPGVGWIEASWSPNSEWIVYRANSDDPLLLVQSDGSSRTPLPTSPLAAEPQWSPDGQWIAYTECSDPASASPFCPLPEERELRVMRPDGTGDRLVVKHAALPTWSPDSSTILFQRRTDAVLGNSEQYSYHTVSLGNEVVGDLEIDTPAERHSVGRAFWQPVLLSDRPAVVGLVDPSQGLWRLFDDAGVLTGQFFYGNPGDFPIVGDWDCDGVETPGMYRQSDGYVYLRNSNTQGAADIRFFFGDPGDVPIAGDFNNDGCDTVSIYRPSNQTFFIINALGANDGGLGAAEFSYVFGDPGDKPFVGDFDGNGSETVGLHRESTGLVYFRNSHTQGNADAQFIFGDPGDRLIAGDWNNNGAYSPALYRPGNTTFYFRYTNTQGNADNQFVPVPNGTGWLPVAGDFGE